MVAATVAIHTLGFSVLLRAIARYGALETTSIMSIARWVMGLACWLILIHLLEIGLWALFYVWRGCLAEFEPAFYFSGATYTTVGYGDIVLPKACRTLAPVEALTGILMCALSTGLFFGLVQRWIANRTKVIHSQ